MRIKPLEFLKSALNQGIFSKPKRSLVYVVLAAILAGIIVTFSVPAVARGVSVLFATQGFINEDVDTKMLPALMPPLNCPVGEDSCYDSSRPPDCINDLGVPFPCYKVSPLQLTCTPCPL